MIIYLYPFNILTFSQAGEHNFISLSVSDSLTFTDLVEQPEGERIIGISIEQSIGLDHSYGPKFGIANSILSLNHGVDVKIPISRSVISRLSFGQYATRAIRIDVYELLYLQQFINRPQHDELDLDQTVDYDLCKVGESTIELTDSVLVGFIDLEELEDELELSHGVSIIKDNDSSCLFQAIELPSVTKRDYITLNNTIRTITIRAPEFGDKDANQHLRIQRKTLGGDLTVHRESSWPKPETLSYTFHLLKQDDANTIKRFFEESIGKQITLEDHYTQTWTGVILTPSNEIVQENRFTWTVSFDFEGTLS